MKTTAERRPGWPAPPNRSQLWLELLGTYILVPAVVGRCLPPRGWIPALWLVCLLVWWRTQKTRPEGNRSPHPPSPPRLGPVLKRVLIRFALAAVTLAAAIAVIAPEQLFDWPRQRTQLWTSVLVLYPLLSVLPQEMLYRELLFRRLRTLCLSEHAIVLCSALAFGFVHAIYRNAPAVALSAIGGWFFADTYRRSGSLALVCCEHALYGGLVFTIGLGDRFSHFALNAP